MSDMDIINSIADEPARPPEFVSLETIINEIPNQSINNPGTFYLYLHHNKKWLTDEEVKTVEKVINKLKIERTSVNNKNIQYLERHKPTLQNEVIKE